MVKKLALITLALLTFAGISVCQSPAGAYGPSIGGTSSGGNGVITSSPPPGTINPAASPYNAKFDAGVLNTCTTTNGNNVVTCPGAKFQTGTVGSFTPPAVVGQIFFANDATSGGGGVDTCLDNPDITFGGLRQTTISSVDSDTQVHVVGNAGTTSTAHACVAWGDDDTTALNAAWTAGGCTASLWAPNGKTLFSSPVFQLIAGCPNVINGGTGYQGQRIWGSGVTNTYFIPTPLFDFSSVQGSGGPTCRPNCTAAFGNRNISDYESFNVWGVGERCTGAHANTTLWIVGNATRAINTNGIGWCSRGGGTTAIGYNIQGDTNIYTWGGANFFGSVEMNFNGTSIYFGNSFVTGVSSVTVSTAGILAQNGSSVASVSNGATISLQVGTSGGSAVWNSMNMVMNGNSVGGADTACIFVGNGSVVNLLSNDTVCNAPASNEPAISYFSSGGTVNATNSVFNANGAANAINFGTSAGTFRNNTGNTFSGGAGVFTGTGSFIQGSMSSTTFANLGTPANGSFIYCPDCTIANPCAGSGTGALAKRLNAVWVCN